jgi:hypothetical protein
VNLICDEAHHCYRHKVGGDAEGALTGDDRKEAARPGMAVSLPIEEMLMKLVPMLSEPNSNSQRIGNFRVFSVKTR